MRSPILIIGVLGFLTACAVPPPTDAEIPSSTSSVASSSTQSSHVPTSVSSPPGAPSALDSAFDPLASAPSDIPGRFQLDVPFGVQAPFANWDPPFDEACEEASLLMTEYDLRGTFLSPAVMEREIRALTTWETDHGYPIDVTIAQLADIASGSFGRRAAVYTGDDVTQENIERLVAAGYPVIVPAAGRDLGNPYFKTPGPPYHMLVITGYDGWYFTTNDPGTKRGENYQYLHDTLLDAIHDWNGSPDTIRSGKRVMFVIGI